MKYGYKGENKITGPLSIGFNGKYSAYNGAPTFNIIGEHKWFKGQLLEEGKDFRFDLAPTIYKEELEVEIVAFPITAQSLQPSLEEKKEDLKLPKYLYKDGEYPMQLINGRYQTTTPDCKIGKIGNSYPPKKNFTYNDLINIGWEKKEEDL